MAAETPYAAEQRAFDRPVPGDAARRQAVEAAVVTLRSVWSGTVGGVGGFLRPDPPPPIIIGGFGPKMAELAGRVADGVNLPGGPQLARLLETARAAVTAAGRDPSAFIVTVSSDLRPQALERLEALGVEPGGRLRGCALGGPGAASGARSSLSDSRTDPACLTRRVGAARRGSWDPRHSDLPN